MNDSATNTISPSASGSITERSAKEIAELIVAGELSAREATDAFVQRIEQVDTQLNAVVVKRFEQARQEADEADQRQARGERLGPLHGVPITIKESFRLRGTPCNMGLSAQAARLSDCDGLIVRRVKEAGAIILGKTNLPELMFWHESDNPVYGRTNNPHDLARSCGGSSGGEAAIIAAGGSPIGLASDLGGSIRQPAHACGISGIKPTAYRLPRFSTTPNLRGLEAIQIQPGPMARRASDLHLLLNVMSSGQVPSDDPEVPPSTIADPAEVAVDQLRIGMFTDDGWFEPSPAIGRAVKESASKLRELGARVVPIELPGLAESMWYYFKIFGADGGGDARRLLAGSEVDYRLKRMLVLGRMPNMLRPLAGTLLAAMGQRDLGRIVKTVRTCSADEYWRVTDQKNQFVQQFMRYMQREQLDAVLCPPHGLPAMQHGLAIDLLTAAGYCYLPNLLGVPAGVVPVTRVAPQEESDRQRSGGLVARRAIQVEQGSAGLPIGVQVFANHWREDVVLAIMMALEEAD